MSGPDLPLPPVRLLVADGVGWLPRVRRGLEGYRRQPWSRLPKNLLEEAMDTPNGVLVRRCFRILNAKSIGLTITLADITEEEFRVLELIEAERQEQIRPRTTVPKTKKRALTRPLASTTPVASTRRLRPADKDISINPKILGGPADVPIISRNRSAEFEIFKLLQFLRIARNSIR